MRCSSCSLGCLLERVRNLGLRETPEGTQHWWAQRISALVLAILTPWFVIGVLAHVGQSLFDVRVWLGEPSVAFMMAVFVVVSFWHAAQGMRVVLDDYVHLVWLRDLSIRVVQVGCAVCALIGVGALLMLVCGVGL